MGDEKDCETDSCSMTNCGVAEGELSKIPPDEFMEMYAYAKENNAPTMMKLIDEVVFQQCQRLHAEEELFLTIQRYRRLIAVTALLGLTTVASMIMVAFQ